MAKGSLLAPLAPEPPVLGGMDTGLEFVPHVSTSLAIPEALAAPTTPDACIVLVSSLSAKEAALVQLLLPALGVVGAASNSRRHRFRGQPSPRLSRRRSSLPLPLPWSRLLCGRRAT